MSKYYKNNIPSITKKSVYKDIKLAYFGGITEVYKPHGFDLYYYDVKSLYPYVGLNPMPGLEYSKVEFYKNKSLSDEMFGFFNCKIIAPNNLYLGLLPVRNKSGIYFPTGEWSGWYFSEELKYAQSKGYIISVISGYNFNKVENTFKSYIEDIYKIKSTTDNPVRKSISKSMLNNLFGRFGLVIDKPITKIMTQQEFNDISHIHLIHSDIELENYMKLVSFSPNIDQDLTKKLGLSTTKLVNKEFDQDQLSMNFLSIAISAAITSYGRIDISKRKNYILDNGGDYSDTDSLVTNLALDEKMVSSSELGKLKLEHRVKEGIFITGKTYFLKTTDNKTVIKAKGVNKNKLLNLY